MNDLNITRLVSNNSFGTSLHELYRNKRLLRQYKDKSFIMTILCSKSENFYNSINTVFTIILVLTSSLLAIGNSYHAQHFNHAFQLVNIVINFITILIVSLNNQLKISQKMSEFKIKSQSYNKLTHNIELLLTNDTIEQLHVHNIVSQYDILSDNTDTFPGFIRRYVVNKYGATHTMPTTAISPIKNSNRDIDVGSEGTPPIPATIEIDNTFFNERRSSPTASHHSV